MIAAQDYVSRLERVQAAVANAELAGLLITPGADLRYLTGYQALPLERLTCLVISGDGTDPTLIVPRLERPSAVAAGVEQCGIRIVDWGETDRPIDLATALLPSAGVVAVDAHMTADKVLGFRDALPHAQLELAGTLLSDLRVIKSEFEIDALRTAGAAIDRVHARMGNWLRAGRSEREVGRDIADAILAEGHERVDFVIVASGPNSASAHHEVSDRVIEMGDPVVVDIGGTTHDGYCSDETRTYSIGRTSDEYRAHYAVLQGAQEASYSQGRPGVSAESVDAAGRTVLSDAGLGEYFVHRTGHGIGLETHEEPYIVAGNTTALLPGMAFSIEPGFYIEGKGGARIEDIVVVTNEGLERMNHQPRELVEL